VVFLIFVAEIMLAVTVLMKQQMVCRTRTNRINSNWLYCFFSSFSTKKPLKQV